MTPNDDESGPAQGQAADERLLCFLRADDWSVVCQGVEIGMALGGSGTFEPLAQGIRLDESGALEITDRWSTTHRIRANMRANLALLLLSIQSPSPLADAEQIDLSGYKDLTDLEPLRTATAVRRLRLDGCSACKDASVLAALPALRSLSALECGISAGLPEGGMPALETLTLDIEGAKSIAPLAHSRKLRRLTLRGASVLADLSPLEGLGSLEFLRIDGCATTDLSPLAGLQSLQELAIENVPDGTDPSPLSRLGSLRRLTLGSWSRLDLSRLLPEGSMPCLESIDLSATGGDGLTGFAQIRGAPRLVELCSPHGIARPDGTDLRNLVRAMLPTAAHQLQEGADAGLVLGATMLIEAALGAGPGPGRWTGLRQSMNAAILRGGPQLAKAALGSVIIGEGRIRPTSSSPIRTLAERAGGDWLDDAVLLLMAAAGWPEVAADQPLDLSRMNISDPSPLASLPAGVRAAAANEP
jgi:hypothetical protein